jgi:hypothetical protein
MTKQGVQVLCFFYFADNFIVLKKFHP